jgi:type IV pilus assembly protein PilB
MQSAIKSKTLTDMFLGEALVKKGIITQSELDRALELQKSRKNDYLGEILHSMGVPQEKISNTLEYLNKRKKIGDILIDLGLLTPEDLERALREQKLIQSKMGVRTPLGILLHQMGLVYYREYMRALSKHFVLPIVSLEDCTTPPSLQDVLGKKFILKHQVLVLKNDGHKIKIALSEPTSSLMQEIRKSLPAHKEVIFCLAHPLEIEAAHRQMFDPCSVNRYR